MLRHAGFKQATSRIEAGFQKESHRGDLWLYVGMANIISG